MAITPKLAMKTADSVNTEESGMSVRRNAMFSMIGLRTGTAIIAFETERMMSWKGTTAQASDRPVASPERSRTAAVRIR